MSPRKTRRKDGRFAFTLRYADPITGDRKRATFYGKTQAEARAKDERARQRLSQGAPVRDASRTLADRLAEWQVTFREASNRATSLYVKRKHESAHPHRQPRASRHPRRGRINARSCRCPVLAHADEACGLGQ
jgi:hypothetical protein